MMLLVAHESRVFQMRRIGNQLALIPSSRLPLVSYLTDYMQGTTVLRGLNAGGLVGTGNANPEWKGDQDAARVYQLAIRTLVGNSFGLKEHVEIQKLRLPQGMVRVFVFAPQPETLQITGESFPDQSGAVLYSVDLPLNGGPPIPADSSLPTTSEKPAASDATGD